MGKVAILGAGAWGMTLGVLVSRAGHEATVWMRDQRAADACNATKRHPRANSDLILPNDLVATSDPDEAISQAELVIVAVPSSAVRETARRFAPLLRDALVLSATKGLDEASLLRMTEVIATETRNHSGAVKDVGAISGPNLAGEIAAGYPAVTVMASERGLAATAGRHFLMSATFRCYTNDDLIGVEMGGALKNIIAIGAGIADGLGTGDNAKAAFMTRGIAEIARLGVAAGAKPLTFAGLSGLGDLVTTCASRLSRNHTVGRELARGRSLDEITASMRHVAEGVSTTRAAMRLAERLNVDLPITQQLHHVLYEGKSANAAIADLMLRESKDELLDVLGPLEPRAS